MSPLARYLSRVAASYARAHHEPDNPAVRACYAQFARAIVAQFRLVQAFVTVTPVDVDPYPLSPAMWEDISRGRLSVYTYAELPAEHPMMSVNIPFRAVHDVLAHYPQRLRHDGLDAEPGRDEFRAFRAHVRLMHGNADAIRALFTETVAQNATYHYGATPGTFAEQRATVLPHALICEALTLEV